MSMRFYRATSRESALQRDRRRLLTALWALPTVPAWGGAMLSSAVELDITSDGDNLAFIPNRLNCVTGANVRLRLHHTGRIIDDPHDWVLLKPGMENAFLADADKQQDDKRVIPPHDRNMVVAATPLCARGKTVKVNFIAPAPGNYPFVCSVPGHGETMHGTLAVTVKPQ
jgi:azurin